MNNRGLTLDLAAVREAIATLGLTHADLAERMGMTRAGATNLVQGTGGVSLERAARLAVALEVDVGDILADSPLQRARRLSEHTNRQRGRSSDLTEERVILEQAAALLAELTALVTFRRQWWGMSQGEKATRAAWAAEEAVQDLQETMEGVRRHLDKSRRGG